MRCDSLLQIAFIAVSSLAILFSLRGRLLTETSQYGGPGSNTAQRTASGAGSDPFRPPLATLVGGSKIDLSALKQSTWTSPEDTTNASAKEGGIGCLIAPVDPGHNTS